MNPTANKSDFEDLTTNLRDLAYSYLERYSPSKQQLKVHLLKKYLTKIKDGISTIFGIKYFLASLVIHAPKNKLIAKKCNQKTRSKASSANIEYNPSNPL